MTDEIMDVNDQLEIILKEAVVVGSEEAYWNSAICIFL